MVDHAYEGLRAMCSVDFNCIALDLFGVRSAFSGKRNQNACLLALGLIGRVLPASCCPDTLYKYFGSRALVCVHTAFYLARASQLEK